METYKIWAFLEQKDNKLLKVSTEILSEGRRLADKCNGELTAVLLGSNLSGLVDDVGKYGANKVFLVEHPTLGRYSTLPYCGIIAGLIQKHEPAAVLFGATELAHDLAPRLAARIKTGLVTNCNWVGITEDGTLEVTRPAYGGKISAKLSFTSNKCQLVTISPGAVEVTLNSRQPQVINIKTEKIDEPLTEDMGLLKADPESLNLSEAELIVSGGRGLGNQEGFRLTAELARLLKASVGGTRVAVDNGWIPFEKQVGQTGKTVNPRLFLTVGTSGAIQYTMGFKDSEFILAVDTNPRSPIFQVADVGVVADVHQLIPVLIDLLKNYRAGSAIQGRNNDE